MSCFPEVDRALDNLVKSGKMFGVPGRRDSVPVGAPARDFPQQFGMPRPHEPLSTGRGLTGDRSTHGRWPSTAPLGRQ
jgi:hypothetical protein